MQKEEYLDETIFFIDQNEIDNPEGLNKKILTEINKLLPVYIKESLNSPHNRQLMLEKHGDDFYLDPDNMKFPVMNKRGKYDCNLIYAAMIRSKQFGKSEIYSKAKELYKQNKCANKINIHINDCDSTLALHDFLDLFEINFNQIKNL